MILTNRQVYTPRQSIFSHKRVFTSATWLNIGTSNLLHRLIILSRDDGSYFIFRYRAECTKGKAELIIIRAIFPHHISIYKDIIIHLKHICSKISNAIRRNEGWVSSFSRSRTVRIFQLFSWSGKGKLN